MGRLETTCNWRDILEEHVEMFDRNVSLLLAEPDIDDETKAILAAIADQEIDSMRRGTFFRHELQEGMR